MAFSTSSWIWRLLQTRLNVVPGRPRRVREAPRGRRGRLELRGQKRDGRRKETQREPAAGGAADLRDSTAQEESASRKPTSSTLAFARVTSHHIKRPQTLTTHIIYKTMGWKLEAKPLKAFQVDQKPFKVYSHSFPSIRNIP